MRQIFLDTETTGREANKGDRVVEIGCVVMIDRRLSEDDQYAFQRYINPERDVPDEVVKVHGLTTEFLSDKPKFAEIVDEFLAFISGAELLMHNAPFDTAFLDMELKRLGRGKLLDYCAKITDTFEVARKIYPGSRNSLDALCNRLSIDRSSRKYHGALLDSWLLAKVYLGMTREQGSLLTVEDLQAQATQQITTLNPLPEAHLLIASVITDQEKADHEAFLERINKKCKTGAIWNQYVATTPKA